MQKPLPLGHVNLMILNSCCCIATLLRKESTKLAYIDQATTRAHTHETKP